MGDAEHWKGKIRELETKKAQANDLSMRRQVHLRAELAAYETRVRAEVAEFARSEEARFMQRELGRPFEWQRDGMVPSNQGMVPSEKFLPPSNVLVVYELAIHNNDIRVYGFSGLGLTEFYRSVSFWIGLSVPARGWAYGDGMKGKPISADHFASNYVKAQFPNGANSFQIEYGSVGYTRSANDSQWDGIGFEEWVALLPNWARSGIADTIRQRFSHYLENR